jgi:hypothetical protein
MALRLCLIAVAQRAEFLANQPQAFVKWQVEGPAHGLDGGGRCVQAARAPAQLGGELLERLRVGAHRRELVVDVAHASQRPFLRQHFSGERERAGQQVALDDLIDEAIAQRLAGGNRIAAHDHAHRLVNADQARQAQRSAGARNDAELDLREPEPGLRHGNAIVTSERHFEAAAERGAMQRGDHRFVGRIERAGDVDALRWRTRLVEFRDVGARDEGAPRAGDHDRRDRGIVARLRDQACQSLAHLQAQRIHRGIVDRYDCDLAVAPQGDELGQTTFLPARASAPP